jgi:hypothetical protein
LANLLPLCVRQHHRVHDEGWRLTLSPDRQLTIELPDGTRQTTGPPQRGPTHPPSTRKPAEPIEPVEATASARPDVLQPLLL